MFTLAEDIYYETGTPHPYPQKNIGPDKPLMSLITIFFYHKAHFYNKVWPRAINFIGQSISYPISIQNMKIIFLVI